MCIRVVLLLVSKYIHIDFVDTLGMLTFFKLFQILITIFSYTQHYMLH